MTHAYGNRYYPETLFPSITPQHTHTQYAAQSLSALNLPMGPLTHFPLFQVSGWARKCLHLSPGEESLPTPEPPPSYPSPTWGVSDAHGISQL